MKIKMISPMIAGLVMVCAVYAFAETNTPDKPSIDTPVSTVQMDSQGNIKQMTFRNGYVLKEPEINLPGDVVERGGVSNRRQLQFILGLTNSRRPPPSCFCGNCGGDCCPSDPQSARFGAPQGNRLNRDGMPHWQDSCLRPGPPQWSPSGKLLTSPPFFA